MNKSTTNNFVNEKEFTAAEQAAEKSLGTYTHKFRKPLLYEGKTYEEISFRWEDLTGNDGLAIENEMQALGRAVVVPAFSGEYLIRMAARACTDPLGTDAFRIMSLADYNGIRNAARSFLLKSEL